MNFNLKFSVLGTMAVTILLTGSTASAVRSQNLSGQQVLIDDRNIPAAVMTYPHLYPGSNTVCSFPVWVWGGGGGYDDESMLL